MTTYLGRLSICDAVAGTENPAVVGESPPPQETAPPAPLADPVAEARRTLAAASDVGVPLKAIGGVGIRLRANGAFPAGLERAYGDIDLVTGKGRNAEVAVLLAGLGYVPDQRFNALHGARRMIFHDEANGRHLDVFVGAFEMCHTLPLAERLTLEPLTVPAADLLLTKLQIVQLNRKDISDALALVLVEPVQTDGDDGINAGTIARLCATDWGLWRTCRQSIERLQAEAGSFGLDAPDVASIRERLRQLWARVEAEPKSSKWRLRDRIGDRKRWYEEPEESL